MTRDDIIEAAWKSGVWIPAGQGHAREQEIDRLERFAHLVAAAERDRVCEQFNIPKELAHEKAKSNETNRAKVLGES